MPPLKGPRASLCCDLKPVKTLISPSSILVGIETVRTRFGCANIWCTPLSSFINLAASSSCFKATSNGFIVVADSNTILFGKTDVFKC